MRYLKLLYLMVFGINLILNHYFSNKGCTGDYRGLKTKMVPCLSQHIQLKSIKSICIELIKTIQCGREKEKSLQKVSLHS